MKYAMSVSLSGHMSAKTIGPIHTYLKRFSAEYVMLSWQLGYQRIGRELDSTPEFIDFASQYGAVFKN